jgi:hypothetical protein
MVLFCSIVCGTIEAQVGGISSSSSLVPADSTRKNNTMGTQIEATLYSGVNIGIGFGYGFKQSYDFGLNVRAGISSESRIYIGGIFNYNFGRSLTQTFDSTSLSLEKFSYSVAGELGYDALIEKKAILRPSVAVGFITFRDVTDIRGKIVINNNETISRLLISPGMFVQFPLSHDIFWGAELRYTIVTGEGDYNGFGLYTNFLFRF